MAFEGSKTLAEQIAKHLADQIIRSELLPGERMFEAKVAGELNVSRTPVREAFRMLEKSRLMEISPHRGSRVTELSRSTIENAYDLWMELTVLMIKGMVENLKEEDIEKYRSNQRKLKEAVDAGDSRRYYEIVLGPLMETAWDISRNPFVKDAMLNLIPTMSRIVYGIISQQIENLQKNYQFVERAYQCTLEGNLDGAEEALRDLARSEKELGLRMYDKIWKPLQKAETSTSP